MRVQNAERDVSLQLLQERLNLSLVEVQGERHGPSSKGCLPLSRSERALPFADECPMIARPEPGTAMTASAWDDYRIAAMLLLTGEIAGSWRGARLVLNRLRTFRRSDCRTKHSLLRSHPVHDRRSAAASAITFKQPGSKTSTATASRFQEPDYFSDEQRRCGVVSRVLLSVEPKNACIAERCSNTRGVPHLAGRAVTTDQEQC